MHKTLRLLLLLFPLGMAAQPKIQLVNFASGFVFPVDVAHCGDSRMFVVERAGIIWALDSTGARLDTFLYINNRVNSTQNEQGLLGLAFDPNFAENGYFYVDYIQKSNSNTRVSRFKVKPDNPNRADPDSEFPVLEQTQPYWNHNGGCLKFGPDGFLYISFGDGGGAGDGQNSGQNKQTFLGKILRIDVRNSNDDAPYAVPPDNPFVNDPAYMPEIWSLGWRNPWRYSFDRLTGDMWVGDVGQNLWEEVDFEPANTPGRNYGWRCYEGTHTFTTSGCQPSSAYTMPFFDYAHNNTNGCSVTGGFVYRGSLYPDLYGAYVFGDYCSGRLWYTRRNADGSFNTQVLASLGGYEFSAFAEDYKGELYACQYTSGKVMKIKELCSPFQINSSVPLAVCEGSMAGSVALTATGATGAVSYLWSTGATSSFISGLNPGIYSVEVKDGNNCIRRDTVEVPSATPATPVILTPDTVVCAGMPFKLAIAPPASGVTYEWFKNGFPVVPGPDGIFLADISATYQAAAVGQQCESPLSNPVQVAVADVPVILLSAAGDTIAAQVSPPNASLQWYLFGAPIPGATGTSYVAEQSGNYTAVASTAPGCQSSATISIVVSFTTLPESVRRFTMAPNPAGNLVRLELEQDNAGTVEFALIDSNQHVVFSQNAAGRKIALPIDLSNLPSGTYFLRVKTKKGSFVRGLIKK